MLAGPLQRSRRVAYIHMPVLAKPARQWCCLILQFAKLFCFQIEDSSVFVRYLGMYVTRMERNAVLSTLKSLPSRWDATGAILLLM